MKTEITAELQKRLEANPWFVFENGKWSFRHDGKSYIDDETIDLLPLCNIHHYGKFLTKSRAEAQDLAFRFLNAQRSGGPISKRELGLIEWLLSPLISDGDDPRKLPHQARRKRGEDSRGTKEQRQFTAVTEALGVRAAIKRNSGNQKAGLLDAAGSVEAFEKKKKRWQRAERQYGSYMDGLEHSPMIQKIKSMVEAKNRDKK